MRNNRRLSDSVSLLDPLLMFNLEANCIPLHLTTHH